MDNPGAVDEVATLLYVADIAVERAIEGSAGHAMASRAQRLITSRLWPDLGALLDDDEEDGE